MGNWWCILCLKVSTKVEKWGCVFAPHSVFWCVSNYYSAGVTLRPRFCMLSVYLYVYILWVCVFFSYVHARVCVYVRACLCVCMCVPRTRSFSALRISDQLWDRTLDSFIVNKGCRWGVSPHTKTCWSHADQRSAANTHVTHCRMRFLIKSVFLPHCFILQAISFFSLLSQLQPRGLERHRSALASPLKTPSGFSPSLRSQKIIRSMSQLFSAGVQILSACPFTATDWRLLGLCRGWRTGGYETTKLFYTSSPWRLS